MFAWYNMIYIEEYRKDQSIECLSWLLLFLEGVYVNLVCCIWLKLNNDLLFIMTSHL